MKNIFLKVLVLGLLVGALYTVPTLAEYRDNGSDDYSTAQIYIARGFVQTNAYGRRSGYKPSIYQWGWREHQADGIVDQFTNDDCVHSSDYAEHARAHYCSSCDDFLLIYANATIDGSYTLAGYV